MATTARSRNSSSKRRRRRSLFALPTVLLLVLWITVTFANENNINRPNRIIRDLWSRSLPGKIIDPQLQDDLFPSADKKKKKKKKSIKKRVKKKVMKKVMKSKLRNNNNNGMAIIPTNVQIPTIRNFNKKKEVETKKTATAAAASSLLVFLSTFLSNVQTLGWDGLGLMAKTKWEDLSIMLENPSQLELLGIGSGVICSIPILAEALARLGWVNLNQLEFPTVPPKKWQSSNTVLELTLVFHGTTSSSSSTAKDDEAFQRLIQVLESKSSQRKKNVLVLDWSKYARTKFLPRVSFHAQKIGKGMARSILRDIQKQHQHLYETSYFYQPNQPPPTLQLRLHVVGVSVGAFAADAFVTDLRRQLKKQKKNAEKKKKKKRDGNSSSSSIMDSSSSSSSSTIDCYIQETLLDPYCARGVLDLDYGVRRFGAQADYAQQIVSRTDKIPTTNDYLNHCVVWDITGQLPSRVATLLKHAEWPVLWYSTMAFKKRHRNIIDEEDLLFNDDDEEEEEDDETTSSRSFVRLPMGFVPPKDQLERGEIVIL